MLSWSIGIRPRWTKGDDIKKRMQIFKRYAGDALLATRRIFREEFYRRTNASAGTHIKSRRISTMLITGEVDHQEQYSSLSVEVTSPSTEIQKIALAHEFGSTIVPKTAKLLTVPRNLKPELRGKARQQSAHWVKFKNTPALVSGEQKKTGRKPPSGRSAQRARKPRRTNLPSVLYWGKEQVILKPRNFFSDSVAATNIRLKREFPKSVRIAWNMVWHE